MADIADRAADESAVYERARNAAREAKEAPVHNLDCDLCGMAIPLARREALVGHDCLMCIDCQSYQDRRGGVR